MQFHLYAVRLIIDKESIRPLNSTNYRKHHMPSLIYLKARAIKTALSKQTSPQG